MAAGYGLAQRYIPLWFFGAVLILGSSNALSHEKNVQLPNEKNAQLPNEKNVQLPNEKNVQLPNSLDYKDHLGQITEGAELLKFTSLTDLLGSPEDIKVNFTSTKEVKDIDELILFVIKVNPDETSEQNCVKTTDPVSSISSGTEVSFTFPYDESLPGFEDGDKASLVLIARKADTALAAGEFTFVLQSTSASLVWVGAASDKSEAFLRVDTESSIIGSTCSCDGNQPCYCPHDDVPEPDNVKMCVEITGTGNNNNALTVTQCGGSVTPSPFQEISSIDNAELHTKADDSQEFEIGATYDTANSKKVEILFYQADPPSGSILCEDISSPCIAALPDEMSGAESFNILLVALNKDGVVVESQHIPFSDYLIELTQLSSDAVEVTWTGSSSTEYEVLIDDTNAPFQKTVGNGCEDGKCKAYFVKTESTIKCTVYTTDDSTMKSSRSLKMSDGPTKATFKSINKLETSKISVDVTSDSAISSNVVSLVVINVADESGIEQIYEGTPAAVMRVEDTEYQFPVKLEPSEDKVYFILVGHQNNGDVDIAGTASGVIKEVSAASLSWVGAAYSEDDNKATLRSGTTYEPDSCVCDSTNDKPCYCIHTDLNKDDIIGCSDLDDGVQYCEKNAEAGAFTDLANIIKSRLLYSLDAPEQTFEFEAEVANAKKYELLFLTGDDALGDDKINDCDAPSACSVSLTNLPAKSQTYQVLAVALDDAGAVLQSKDFPFEDYKVILQAVTTELILVNWISAEDTTYSVDCKAVSDGDNPAPTTTRCQNECMIIRDGVTCGPNLYTVDVKENKEGTTNIVAGQVETLSCFTEELSMSTPQLRYDDRIRVCFSKPETAHQYQLILEHEGVVIEAHFYDAAQLDVDNEEQLCLVGRKSLFLGSHVDLRAVVVVYDNDGTVIAFGKTNWEAILLSSNHWVEAATTDGTTIISSWQVIDDTQGIDHIQLTLNTETTNQVVKVSSDHTSYKVENIAAGSYSMCIRAMSSTIQSEEVCSGIITISDNSNINISKPETAKPKSSGKDSVMITWDQQEDVTAYMAFWRSSTSVLSRSKLIKPLNSLVPLQSIKNGGVGSEEYFFKIIPASSSSFEINGLDKGEWDVCLSGVKDGIMGTESCEKSQVDPDNFEMINAPENLRIDNSILKWDAINDINKYFVEWMPYSSEETGGHLEISETSFKLTDIINPGKWSYTVRAVKDSQLGDTQTIVHTLKGIQINWYQVGSSSLLVEWQEMPDPETSNATYVVSYHQEDDSKTIEVNCNYKVTSSCQVYLLDIEVDTTKTVALQVARKEEDTKNKINIQMRNLRAKKKYDFSDTIQLEQTMRSVDHATVSWTEVEGAKGYNVSLYRDQQLLTQKWQTLPRSVTFNITDLEGCNVQVQPCIDNKLCVDGKQIQLKIVTPEPSGEVDGLVVVSILGGILGAAIVVSAIIVVVYKYRGNRRESHEGQINSNVSGDRPRRLSTVSILGQTQYNNNMEYRPSRPTYDAWRTQ